METKPALASMTIQGIIVSVLGSLTPQIATWLHMPPDDTTKLIAAAVTVVGALYAAWGRFRATKGLH